MDNYTSSFTQQDARALSNMIQDSLDSRDTNNTTPSTSSFPASNLNSNSSSNLNNNSTSRTDNHNSSTASKITRDDDLQHYAESLSDYEIFLSMLRIPGLSRTHQYMMLEMQARVREYHQFATSSRGSRRKSLHRFVKLKVNAAIGSDTSNFFVEYFQQNYTRKIKNFEPKDFAFVLLYLMCFYPSMQELSKVTKFDGSKIPQVLDKVSVVINNFTENHLTIGSANEREEASRMCVDAGNYVRLNNLRDLLDGTDMQVHKPSASLRIFNHDKINSYKFNSG